MDPSQNIKFWDEMNGSTYDAYTGTYTLYVPDHR
jgi:hypothetical protein